MASRPKHKISSGQFSALLREDAKPGRHSDGSGLYLVVGPGASRRWVLLYRWNGRTREMGLGRASELNRGGLGLSDARTKAEAARTQVQNEVDPITARNALRARPTFEKLAEDFLSLNEDVWKNSKHRQQWRTTLLKLAAPLGKKRVDDITIEDVADTLRPIWTTKPETARRTRGRIERVMDRALALGFITGPNPARWKGGLEHRLDKSGRPDTAHFTAMPYAEVPEFFDALKKRDGVSAMALAFLILTAARSGEVRGATWQEIDLEKEVWSIPGERMKTGKPHRVPLSTSALETLNVIRPLSGGADGDLVFPGQKGRPLSNSSLSAVLRRMDVPNTKATVHGFRSAFRDWAFEETKHSREIIEISLAHVVGSKTERAYRRGDALDRRRHLIEHWQAYLTGSGDSNVVPMSQSGNRATP